MGLVALGLSLLTACSTTGERSARLFTPASASHAALRVSVLSVEKHETPIAKQHFVPSKRSFQVTLPARVTFERTKPAEPHMQLASARAKPEPARYCVPPPSPEPRLELTPLKLPAIALQRTAPVQNDFYLTLGTSVVDPEKDPNWTNAAIYPQVPSTRALPVMRVYGQSARSLDHIQVAPGFFWWASDSCCVSFSVPMRVMGTASDWGVLLALNY